MLFNQVYLAGLFLAAVFTIVSGVASIISLFLAIKRWKLIIIHAAYGIFIAVLATALIAYQAELAEVHRIESQAMRIVTSTNLWSSGSQRGFMLGCLAFLEKYKDRFPATFQRAVNLCDNAGVTESRPESYIKREHQDRQLEDAAESMRSLLTGIAAGK